MGATNFYCVSLSHLGEYLVSEKRLSMYPINGCMDHTIRQVMDLAMDTFEKSHLVVSALPSSFQIDAVPEAWEDELKSLLEGVLMMKSTTISISHKDDKMNIFLHG